MLADFDTNFTVTSKHVDDAKFGELYVFKWTTLLIPPTTLIIINIVGVVTGFSDALNRGHEAWGSTIWEGLVFFLGDHLYPFLQGLMERQNRIPSILVYIMVSALGFSFYLVWVKIDPFDSKLRAACPLIVEGRAK